MLKVGLAGLFIVTTLGGPSMAQERITISSEWGEAQPNWPTMMRRVRCNGFCPLRSR